LSLEAKTGFHRGIRLGGVSQAGRTLHSYGMDQTTSPLRPLVKIHPETGRPSMQIGRHAHAIPGMDAEASERFLEGLVDWACQPPRTYHHRWEASDVVLWDNRCLLHGAMPWELTLPRVMWHSRLTGDAATEAASTLATGSTPAATTARLGCLCWSAAMSHHTSALPAR
jgi:alpha-ketoglutarate-dependent taurine dioxygenase